MIFRILSVSVFVGWSAAASAQTFDLTADQFQSRYSSALKSRRRDDIKSCAQKSKTFSCRFEDAAFRRSESGMKELNLANGHFEMKSNLIFETDGSKVKIIIISGDRGDPMNLFHFIGQLLPLLRALGPELSDDEVARTAKQLGLMRGDSDPTIGRPITEITDHFAVTCNNQASSVTTKIGCVFEPRY